MHKKIYIFGGGTYLLLCVILLLIDPSMKAYNSTDLTAPFWYYITISGNFIPEVVTIVILFIAVFLMNRNSRKRYLSSALIVMLIAVTAVSTALVSNFFLKDLFHTPRPSHKIFLEDGFIPSGLDSFYLKNNTFRRNYLTEHVDPKDAKLSGYYSPDVNVWLKEVGGSFPSGHSLNSFLIGILFSYLLFYFLKSRLKYLALIPLLWALLVSLSRYFVGVHEKIDIAGGAFIGMALAFLIVKFNLIDRINDRFILKELNK